MTLKETFSSNQLTSGQSTLIDLLETFLADNSTCFLLKGYAGTGKTFLMQGLTDFLSKTKRSFVIAAPTGRAAKVISQKTKHKATTIHKAIYSNKDIKEYKVQDEDGTETFKFYYELKNNEDQANTVYIIDEASMLSDVYSEGEFFRFGSGYLLKDLLKYINFDNNDHRKKVIFIGDNAQLPPVNMNFSPALNCEYLSSKYSLQSQEFELTEIVRQKENSGIVNNAKTLRKSLQENIFNQLDIDISFSDVTATKQEDLLNQYLQACNNQIDDETIIVAYSNSSVKEYNDFVRNHFFPNQPVVSAHDKVILVSNNYNYQIELLNGDFGRVKEVSSINETRTITLKRKNRNGKVIEVKVPLTFRDAVITFNDVEQNRYDISCKIIENLLYSKFRDLSSDELKALYIDFKIRHPKLQNGTKEFKDALRNDKYFNALRLKFGYAVTCHKAQGGEWNNAFVNCKTSMGYFNSSYFRWLYTAITRAKASLYCLDEPHFKIESSLKSSNNNITTRQDLLVIKPDVLENEIQFNFAQEQSFCKNIFLAIFETLKDEGITIEGIAHYQFCEQYTFSKGNEKAIFKIYYNNKNKITSIQSIQNGNDFSSLLNDRLQTIIHKTIVIDLPDTETEISEQMQQQKFEFTEPFLSEFYNSIKGKIELKGISVNDIKHHNYLEKYEFKKGNFYAKIDFYYNGKRQFNRYVPQPMLSTSPELLTEIIELIGEIKNV